MDAELDLGEPLTREDLDRLDDFLLSANCGDNAMSVDEVHGLLTAAVCGPETIAPSEWLPVVFAGDPEFSDIEQARDILSILMRMNNEISESLRDPDPEAEFEPMVALVEEEGQHVVHAEGWCDGFLGGVALRSEPWLEHMKQGETLSTMLYPIYALSSGFQQYLEEQGDEPVDRPETQQLLDLLPTSVTAAYSYWRSG